MFIPGEFIAAITFPGVIVHEAAHQLFCRFFRVAVFEVVYFRFGNPAGYVLHETPRHPHQHIWIGIGPFLINTIVGMLIAAPAAPKVLEFDTGDVFDYALIWLGVSIAMHAFPSTGDAQSIWSGTMNPKTPLWVKAIAAPIVGVIYLGAIGSMFWVDLIYGVAIALLPSQILAKLLA